uniref:ARAD1C26620p n=1 Tax=Blastobotrys adeninivorans TaxID=409370 RepID=A0A060T790_BLAAD
MDNDEYIFTPPPPPPPPSSGTKHTVEQSTKKTAVRPGPYDRPDVGDEQAQISPAILEAAADVEKWIAERKKNWPTAKRIAEKKEEQGAKANEEDQKQEQTKPTTSKVPCKWYNQGRCLSGANCKFLHQKVYKRFEPPGQKSLYKRLVQNDLDHEDNKVLDFIVYLKENGHLE